METRVIPPPQASARQTEMGERFNRVLFSALDAMEERSIPFALIGGIAASGMGRPRSTHDIDFFVRPEDAEAALEALGRHGFDTERTDPRWLFKGWKEDQMVDIIFKSQGDIYFDNEMQNRAKAIDYHGRNIPAVAPEDLVIIKAAVHSEIGPHHWHDALAILSHANVDYHYLLKRARRAPRRLLALLTYAQSNDIWIPNQVVMDLHESIYGHSVQPPSYSGKGPKSHSAPTTPRPPNPDFSRSSVQHQASAPSAAQNRPHDVYLIGHIQSALAADGRTAVLDVQIAVGGNRILIKGDAPTPESKDAINEVIASMAQGFQIDNQVRIMELSEPHVEEIV